MNIFVDCPHCYLWIEIVEINCAIFRHGILKSNSMQINPHSSEIDCKYFIDNNLIYGCGKPFKILHDGTKYNAIICDYI